MAFSMLDAMGDYMAEKPREIVKIDLADIVDDENNDFEVEGGVEIEKKNALLKDSIEQFGLLDPLTVRPCGDGKYKLISGHRRKLAHERLVAEGKTDFQKVDCIVKEATEDDAEQMLIEANIPNREISDWEKLQAVNRMNAIFDRREAAGEKVEGRRRWHIADVLGMSVSAVGRLEKIEKKLGPEYKKELQAGNIGVSVADKIASKTPEEQAELHATKGAKVKLMDLSDKEPKPKEPAEESPADWQEEPEEQKQEEPAETRAASEPEEAEPYSEEEERVAILRQDIAGLEIVIAKLADDWREFCERMQDPAYANQMAGLQCAVNRVSALQKKMQAELDLAKEDLHDMLG